MDPLSVTASIVGLFSLAVELTKIISEYSCGVADAPRNASDLLKELASLRHVLQRLGEFLKHDQATSAAFDQSSALFETSAVCRDRLLELLERFQKVKAKKLSRIIQRLVWPLDEKETTRVLEALHRWTQTFSLSLTIDGCDLLSKSASELHLLLDTSRSIYNTTKNVPLLASSAEQTLKVVQRLELIAESSSSQSRGSLERIENLASSVHNQSIDGKWRGFLDWLSDHRHESRHQELQARRVEGTGEWLLKERQFELWRDEENLDNQVLWCHGIPGAGKTFLVSLVIDYLRKVREPQRLAYFYFEYQYEERHRPVVLICSLIKQLLQYDGPPPLSQGLAGWSRRLGGDVNFTQMMNDFEEKRDPADIKQLTTVLLKISRTLARPFIIIDALDECDSQQNRNDIMDVLKRLSTCSRVLIASRSHLSIESKIGSCRKIAIEASIADIDLFLRRKLDEDENFAQMTGDHHSASEALKEQIIEVIGRKSQGMFFLPVLQLENILEQVTPAGMRDALNESPDGLSAVFRLTLERVARQSRPRAELADAVMTWVAYAERPLTVSELRHAVAIKADISTWTPELVSPLNLFKQHCVQFCLGLVMIDTEGVVNFVHFSLAEYFLREKASIFPSAEKMMVQACLRYLNLDGFRSESFRLATVMRDFPFLEYAARHWGAHARQCQHYDEEFLQGAIALLSNSSIQPLLRALGTVDGSMNLYTPLHVSAFHGLHLAVAYYLDMDDTDADSVRGALTPLQIAVEEGYPLVVDLLLKRNNVNPNRVCSINCAYQMFSLASPLQLAAWIGDLALVKSLVSCSRIDMDLATYQPTALTVAATRRHWSVVQLLTLRGASVNSRGYDGRTALHHAIVANEEIMVRLLLQREDIRLNLKDEDGLSPLHLAITQQHYKISKMLLSVAIDPNLQDNAGRTPLWLACYCGQLEVALSLLCDERTDPNICGPNGDSPLSTAVRQAPKEVNGYGVLLDGAHRTTLDLIEAFVKSTKVNVNSKNNHGTTALHAAASHPKVCFLRAILSRADVQVNLQDKSGQTVVHKAAANDSNRSLGLLLERNDVDVWRKDHRGRSGLHHAACRGMHHNIRSLLTHDGAQVNEADAQGMTPLHCAAAADHVHCIQELLLDSQSQLNDQDDNGDTPLHHAVSRVAWHGPSSENENISHNPKESPQSIRASGTGNAVTLLGTWRGIELNITNRRGITPLHLAVLVGKIETVHFLSQLPHIDVNIHDDHGRTPLHLAAWCDRRAVLLELLCDANVDKNVQDEDGNTPLHYSTAQGQLESVKLLYEHNDIKVDAKNGHGQTALHLAACSGDASIMHLLSKPRSASDGEHAHLITEVINSRDQVGNTPLHAAVAHHKVEATECLLQHPDVDINCQNSHGETALHVAAGLGFSDIAERLVGHKDIDFLPRDVYGLSVIDVARDRKFPFGPGQTGWDPTFQGRKAILKMLFLDSRAWVRRQVRRSRSLENLL
ncbi:MAG: hypothetical protein Q9165_002016 [Trypethelium subeluteriae]